MTSAQHTRPLVNTVTGHIVAPDWATRVVSPLHDVLSESQRHAILTENPDSYLHVTSDPVALPEPRPDGEDESVQARALRRLLSIGAYTSVPQPALFVYRLTEGGHEHTGVIASVAVEGFSDGQVLGHEGVQPARVDGLVRHYDRVPMRSELVALFHGVDPLVAETTARVTARPPLLAFTDASGIAQSVWEADGDSAEILARQVGALRLYIADGHHRVAAATRSWELSGRAPERGRLLCAIYPQDDVVLHSFHRRVRGPVDVPSLLSGLGERFHVTPADGDGQSPSIASGSVGLYADRRWYVLQPREPRRLPGVAGLDVTMLEEQVLRPLLGITQGDPRLEFVPDLRDLGTTTRDCDGDAGVLFTLHAPAIEDVISVAERREVMSTKTTYVHPKPRTGIFLS